MARVFFWNETVVGVRGTGSSGAVNRVAILSWDLAGNLGTEDISPIILFKVFRVSACATNNAEKSGSGLRDPLVRKAIDSTLVVRSEYLIDILDLRRLGLDHGFSESEKMMNQNVFIPNEHVLVEHCILRNGDVPRVTRLDYVDLSLWFFSFYFVEEADLGDPEHPRWSRITKGMFRDLG